MEKEEKRTYKTKLSVHDKQKDDSTPTTHAVSALVCKFCKMKAMVTLHREQVVHSIESALSLDNLKLLTTMHYTIACMSQSLHESIS